MISIIVEYNYHDELCNELDNLQVVHSNNINLSMNLECNNGLSAGTNVYFQSSVVKINEFSSGLLLI